METGTEADHSIFINSRKKNFQIFFKNSVDISRNFYFLKKKKKKKKTLAKWNNLFRDDHVREDGVIKDALQAL